jgi:hypothetical protein
MYKMTTYKSNIPKKSKIPQRIRQSWNRPIRPPEPEKSWWETLSVEMKGAVATVILLAVVGLGILMFTYVPVFAGYVAMGVAGLLGLGFIWSIMTLLVSGHDAL